jgi:hypothetical protein
MKIFACNQLILPIFFIVFNTNTMQKGDWTIIHKKKRKLAAILNFRRHFVPDKKLSFYEICVI